MHLLNGAVDLCLFGIDDEELADELTTHNAAGAGCHAADFVRR